MLRYSTPTIQIETDMNLAEFAELWLTFKQDNTILRKTKEDLTIEGTKATVVLSQEETGMFNSDSYVRLQLRFLTTDGTAGGSNIVRIEFYDVLDEEVIV